MKLLTLFTKNSKRKDRKIGIDKYQESLDAFGREQFKKLIDKGISIQLGNF